MRLSQRIPALCAISWAIAMLGGCSDSGPAGPRFEVSFDSSLARSARDRAVRVEVYLVSSCADVSMGERPVEAVAAAYVIKNGEQTAFGGALPDGDFGLYGLARDEDCAVVAAGCAPVSIGNSTGTLAVTLSSFVGAACPTDKVCSLQSGNCVDGSGGTGGAGGQPLMRVDAGLIALYDFEEGSGDTVLDQSSELPTHDLTIADPQNVTWSTGYLRVDTATQLSTPGPATKLVDRAQTSGELTVEAWVRPASATQGGPSRIVSMSLDPQVRNFMLGQEDDTYAARFRAFGQSDWDNGSPTIFTTSGTATTLLTHVVHTHKADGSEVLYVDGVEDTTFTRTGDLSQWDASYPLLVANEGTDDRPWLGELHLIAIYDRALDAAEVQRNFDAGP